MKISDADYQFSITATPDLADDPRFATLGARSQNMIELLDTLAERRPETTVAEAIARLEAQDVPCGPVLRPRDVPSEPHVVAAGCRQVVHNSWRSCCR